jgi:tetratricopeptide (TPR) repeat protein
MQEFEAAEENFRLALEAKQPFPEVEVEADLGVALVGQGRYVEGYPLLNDAIGRGMGNASRHRALALIMIDAKQFREASEQLELSLALREDGVERARLAWLSWLLGDLEKARLDLDTALQMEEQIDPFIGWVREQLDKPAPAVQTED